MSITCGRIRGNRSGIEERVVPCAEDRCLLRGRPPHRTESVRIPDNKAERPHRVLHHHPMALGWHEKKRKRVLSGCKSRLCWKRVVAQPPSNSTHSRRPTSRWLTQRFHALRFGLTALMPFGHLSLRRFFTLIFPLWVVARSSSFPGPAHRSA